MATTVIWDGWCGATDTTTCTSNAWYEWNDSTTDCTTNDTTWVTWTSATETITLECRDATPYQAESLSQEEIDRRHAEQQQRITNARQASEQAEKERVAARKRAMKLLLTNLTKKQKNQFDKHQFFIVQGGKSKRKYRIRSHKNAVSIPMANIDVLHHDNDNDVDHRICFHLSYGIPLGDQLLAQKLMLEHDEDKAIEVSNRHAA